MSEPPPFRAEALAHHRAQAGPGAVLRVAPRWTRRAFWALAILAAGALVAGALVRVDEVRFAPVTARGSELTAVLGAGDAAGVRPGDRARLIPAAGEPLSARIVAVGEPGAGGAPPGGVLVSARAPRAPAAPTGVLRVRVGSHALLTDLVPGL